MKDARGVQIAKCQGSVREQVRDKRVFGVKGVRRVQNAIIMSGNRFIGTSVFGVNGVRGVQNATCQDNVRENVRDRFLV